MHVELCLARLFEGCTKRGDQIGGKLANEPDRVGEHDAAPASELNPAQCRIESGEQAALGANVRAGEPVEQSRLARVRVSDQRHHRDA